VASDPGGPDRRSTFPRHHRLKRQRLIRALFDRRSPDVGVLTQGAVVIRYRLATRAEVGVDTPLQIGFAPGRRPRTHVARNRIKRIMREVYRVRQHGLVDLFSHRPDTLTMMVLFRGTEDSAAESIRRDLPEALRRLANRLGERLNDPTGPETV
jgi:ribonuclease P protein component